MKSHLKFYKILKNVDARLTNLALWAVVDVREALR